MISKVYQSLGNHWSQNADLAVVTFRTGEAFLDSKTLPLAVLYATDGGRVEPSTGTTDLQIFPITFEVIGRTLVETEEVLDTIEGHFRRAQLFFEGQRFGGIRHTTPQVIHLLEEDNVYRGTTTFEVAVNRVYL